MDGLDRLIEMLEKRFGKFWADLLLIIVVLGAVGWALNAFVVDLVIPAINFVKGTIGYFRGEPLALTKENIRSVIIQLTLSGVTALVVYALLRVLLGWAQRRGAAISKQLDTLMQSAKQETTLMRAEYKRLTEIRAELKTLVSDVTTRVGDDYDRLGERLDKEKQLLEELEAVFAEGVAARTQVRPEDE